MNDLNPLTFTAGVPSVLPDRVRRIFTSGEVLKLIWALPIHGRSRLCKGGGCRRGTEHHARQIKLANNQAKAHSLAIFKPWCQIFLSTKALDRAAKCEVLTVADRDNMKYFASPLVPYWYYFNQAFKSKPNCWLSVTLVRWPVDFIWDYYSLSALAFSKQALTVSLEHPAVSSSK